MYLELIKNFGFEIACLAVVSGFLGWLIRYIIKEASKREETYQNIITNHIPHNTEAMQGVIASIKEFRKSVEQAHDYQRDEHMKMIEKLIEKK